jgi:SOS-response transcriptional repressor LexA
VSRGLTSFARKNFNHIASVMVPARAIPTCHAPRTRLYVRIAMRTIIFPAQPAPFLELIPLLGEIAAGRPGGVEERAEACIPVSFEALEIPKNARCFVLRVKGDSMVGAHIVDGDLVVLELKPPHDGAIVAALIDGEAVLKRYVVKGGKPYLRAENPRYPELAPAQELVIQGVLRAVIRKSGA